MVSFSICNRAQKPRASHWHWRIGTGSFSSVFALVKGPLLKVSKKNFIKAAFQGSIETQMNLLPLWWISESTFPTEGRGNTIRKGGYSSSKRGRKFKLVILYLVIFLTTVLWKAHKQKQKQISPKYCALYIMNSCSEEEGKPESLSALPSLLTQHLREEAVPKALCKTE